MAGSHLLKHDTRLQSGIALSNGEAELHSLDRGACESLGVQQRMTDLGVKGRPGC